MIALRSVVRAPFNMNLLRNFRRVTAVLIWLALAITLLRTAGAAPHDGREEKFKVLQTRTRSYTNVTVTTRANSYIFILHSGGMENVQLAELPPEVLQKLGYAVDPRKMHSASAPAQTTVGVRHAESALSAQSVGGQPRGRPAWMRSAGTVLLVLLGGCFAVWFFHCYCLRLICSKTGSEPGLLIWVPYLQIIPMVRAAGMQYSWLWLFYAPWMGGYFLRHNPDMAQMPAMVLMVLITCLLVQGVAWVVWCFKIVKAREKSPWVAALLLSPMICVVAFVPGSWNVIQFRIGLLLGSLIISFSAFLYLAFSSSAADAEPVKYKSMALQTA
jgi:hypothetical protein